MSTCLPFAFDPYDQKSWYFGGMSREDAHNLLLNESQDGTFLVRDSTTLRGDYVLCVRESDREAQVSHYIINRVPSSKDGKFTYKIGEQEFPDMPSLLNFYKIHYLESTPLVRPAPRVLPKVIAKFDFSRQANDDLAFKKGEVLEILFKDEEEWWRARNSRGEEGLIPCNYVMPLEPNSSTSSVENRMAHLTVFSQSARSPPICLEKKLPALAQVIQPRVPNAYDKTALRLQVGDIITVTEMSSNGTWQGELKGKKGHFPFTYVKWIDDDPSAASAATARRNSNNAAVVNEFQQILRNSRGSTASDGNSDSGGGGGGNVNGQAHFADQSQERQSKSSDDSELTSASHNNSCNTSNRSSAGEPLL